MTKLYYIAPTDIIFEEVKEAALEIWAGYSDEFGYRSEKLKRVKPIKNIDDNMMFIVAMFDPFNQKKLADKLSKEARKAVHDRIESGGAPDYYNYF